MSDETAAAAEETSDQVADQVEGDAQGEAQAEHESIPLSRVEQIAAAQGWRPGGTADALTFLDNVPKYRDGLVQKLSKLEAEQNKLYDALGLKIKADAARDAAIRSAQLREAVRTGDEELALQLAAEHAIPVQVPTREPQGVSSDVEQWAANNAWIMNDQEKAQEAAAFYDVEMRRLGFDDPAQILPKVEQKMRRLYQPATTPAPAANPNRTLPSATAQTTRTSAIRKVSATAADPSLSQYVDQYKRMGLSDAQIEKSLAKLR